MTAMDQTQMEPTLQMSTDTDINNAIKENKQYEMKCKAYYDEYIKKGYTTAIRLRPVHCYGRYVQK